PACSEFCLIRLLDAALGALIIVLAGLCWAESPRRPDEQADPKLVFQLRNRLGDRRLANADLSRRGRERSTVDDADENLHGSQAIHAHASGEWILSFQVACH